jgi:biotin operon repressor
MFKDKDLELPKVPNQLSLKTGESLEGYLLRLANHNGMLGIYELLGPIPGITARTSLFSMVDHISEISGQKTSDLAKIRELEQGHRTLIHERHYRMKTTPVCPICLKEHGYAKLAWQHTFSTACPEHGIRLVDTCDECGSYIAKDRQHLKACKCGRDLTSIKSTKVSSAEKWINMRITMDISPCPPISDLGNVSSIQWSNFVTLIEFLYAHSKTTAKKSTGRIIKPTSIDDSLNIVLSVLPLFEDFPISVKKLVKFRLDLAPPDIFSAEQRLGYWMTRLSNLCGSGRYPELLGAVRDAVTEYSDGKYHINDKVANTEKSRYLSVAQIARDLCIHEQTVMKMIDRKVLRFIEIPHEAKTRRILIEKSSAEELDQYMQTFVTKADAIQVTGLSKRSIGYFIEYGIFELLDDSAVGLKSNHAISATSIDAFTKTLATEAQPQEGPKIKLKNFAARMTTSSTAHRILYMSLVNGSLKVASRTENSKLADFEFLESDVTKILQSGRGEPLLKVADVSSALKTKEEVIRSWVRQGLIRSVESILRGQKVNLIPVSALAEFQQTYIVLSTLADKLSTSSRMILKAIESQGLKTTGSFEVSDGVSRGYLIEATELGKLLLGQQAKAA